MAADALELARPAPPPRARGTEGQLIYALGDIHGCYDLLKSALAQIAADAAVEARGRTPVLVLLGDYIDRGPDSAKVLQALVWLQRRGDLMLRLLKGNHEQGLLGFLEEPEQGQAWLDYGGAQTLVSYGVAPPDAGAGPQAWREARDALLDQLPASHLQLLGELELMVLVGDYAFVHAGVRPDRPLAAQTEAELLWIRRGFVDAPGPFERLIVHGHTWQSEHPQILEHRLGLDTGAYATGVLTGARLDGETVHLFQARAAA
ncbi:metallophosphoesterase [Phenylobacterium sp. LjRoot225]|uniref:metallophosphoesterase n=1 Tax=Phenylobacterium sp. LjRoot225 TaxID=3342285 RepID=UPI003ED11AF1